MIEKTLPLLKYFHALAQTGSFTKAAEQLCISQSTVSTQVRKLEQVLSVKLINRKNKHQFALTAEGESLAQEVAYSFGRLSSQLDGLQQVSPSSAELTVSASTSLGIKFVLPVIAKLRQQYPDLTLHLQENAGSKHFFEDKIDIATNYGVPDNTFHSVYIGEVEKCVVASDAYIKRFGMPKGLSELAQHSLIAQSHGKQEWQTLFAKSDVDIDSLDVLSVSSNIAKLEAVQLGMGIGLLPLYLLKSSEASLIILPEFELQSLRESLYLICEKRRKDEHKIQWVMDKLASECQSLLTFDNKG